MGKTYPPVMTHSPFSDKVLPDFTHAFKLGFFKRNSRLERVNGG